MQQVHNFIKFSFSSHGRKGLFEALESDFSIYCLALTQVKIYHTKIHLFYLNEIFSTTSNGAFFSIIQHSFGTLLISYEGSDHHFISLHFLGNQ